VHFPDPRLQFFTRDEPERSRSISAEDIHSLQFLAVASTYMRDANKNLCVICAWSSYIHTLPRVQ